MEKFIPKVSPKERMLRKAFKNVGFILAFIIFLLWFIHSEASRIHTKLFSNNASLEYRVEVLEKK